MPNRAYQEHYTAKDYALWQGDWELIYGAPYAMSPAPSFTHQKSASQLHFKLKQALENCQACEVLFEADIHFSDDTVVRPDLLVICNQQGEVIDTTPDLIVEIVAPSSVKRDEQIKFDLYEFEGVKTYIIVYPTEQKAKVFHLKDGKLIKHADFHQETYQGAIRDCAFSLDFSQIWPPKTPE